MEKERQAKAYRTFTIGCGRVVARDLDYVYKSNNRCTAFCYENAGNFTNDLWQTFTREGSNNENTFLVHGLDLDWGCER